MNLHWTTPGLSLVTLSTSAPAYRREAHEDLEDSFERFGVVDGRVKEACRELERAAFELRRNAKWAAPDDDQVSDWRDHRARRDSARRLQEACSRLFVALQPEVRRFLTENKTDPNAWERSSLAPFSPLRRSFLDVVHASLHGRAEPEALARDAAHSLARPWLNADSTASYLVAFQALQQQLAIRSQARDPAAIDAFLGDILDALAHEYHRFTWRVCW